MTDARQVILYGRHACHLCDEMQAQLQPFEADGRLQLELRDVDAREDWRRDFGHRVPLLLTASGEVLSEYQLDNTRLAAWLEENRP